MFGFLKKRRESRQREAEAEERFRKLMTIRQRASAGEVVNCDVCGAVLLYAVPGETSKQQIAEFAKTSKAFSNNKDALNGWIHPGLYCPNGCVALLIEFSR